MNGKNNPTTPTNRTAVWTGLFISLILTTLFWLPDVASRFLPEDLVWRNVAAQLADWVFCLVLIAIVLWWGEKNRCLPWGSKPLTWTNFGIGMGLGGFIMVGLVLWKLGEKALFPELSSAESGGSNQLPDTFFYWFAPFALITASFCEEVIYRGYAMERLAQLTDRKWIVILVPHVAFALMHIKDGWSTVLMLSTLGILFGLYYWRFRDLTLMIVAHFFIDLMAVIGHFAGVRM